MLMHQIDIKDKIPFEIIDKTNNLQQAIENIENGVGLSKVYDSTDEMYKDLGIWSYCDHIKIHHLANQMISIDLDDGVKKNYAVFQDVLAKIK